MPIVRDHATFGMVSGTVTGSITSLYDDNVKTYTAEP